MVGGILPFAAVRIVAETEARVVREEMVGLKRCGGVAVLGQEMGDPSCGGGDGGIEEVGTVWRYRTRDGFEEFRFQGDLKWVVSLPGKGRRRLRCTVGPMFPMLNDVSGARLPAAMGVFFLFGLPCLVIWVAENGVRDEFQK